MPDHKPPQASLPLLPFIVALVAVVAVVGAMLTLMIVWSGDHMGTMYRGSAGLDQTPVVSGEASVTVEMRDNTFFPANLTVGVGTEITWVNRDPVPHDAVAEEGAFASGNIPAGDSWSTVVDQPGVYRYVCTYHNGMEGTLTAS